MKWRVEQNHRNVHTVRLPWSPGEYWFLLSADRHWDNPDSDRKLQKKHLDEAVKRGAGIIDIGDLFCAMQGKFDKRSDKSKVRVERQRGDYLDSLVKTAADWFAPYAGNWIVFGQGNHEAGVLKNHETHLTERLVERINSIQSHKVSMGGYTGWVRFVFGGDGEHGDTRTLHYYHGWGGGGPVTRGVIQTNRTAVYLPDADIVASGHTHDEYMVPIARSRLSSRGVPYIDEALHVRIPSYKDEFRDGYGGWHVERGGPPKPIGAVWLKFVLKGKEIFTETARAK